MFTRDERRALVFLAAVAGLGATVRAVRASTSRPDTGVVANFSAGTADSQLALVDSELALQQPRQRRRERLQGRALQRPAEPGPAIATSPEPPPERAPGLTITVPRERRLRRPRLPVQPGVACPSLPLSINTASAAELTCLPGIGPALAGQIVTWRTAHGDFAQVSDLKRVPGIGLSRFQQVQPYIRAP